MVTTVENAATGAERRPGSRWRREYWVRLLAIAVYLTEKKKHSGSALS